MSERDTTPEEIRKMRTSDLVAELATPRTPRELRQGERLSRWESEWIDRCRRRRDLLAAELDARIPPRST